MATGSGVPPCVRLRSLLTSGLYLNLLWVLMILILIARLWLARVRWTVVAHVLWQVVRLRLYSLWVALLVALVVASVVVRGLLVVMVCRATVLMTVRVLLTSGPECLNRVLLLALTMPAAVV